MGRIRTSIGNALTAFIRGELLMRLGCDKLFAHIVFTFILFWILILMNIMVENTMGKVEKNKTVLRELKIYHTEKKVELARIRRITEADKMLKDRGSVVTFPVMPASQIAAKEQ